MLRLSQINKLSPPTTNDVKTLADYSAIIQRNLQALFGASHTHNVQATVPLNTDGNIGDVTLVDDGTTLKLYGKNLKGIWQHIT